MFQSIYLTTSMPEWSEKWCFDSQSMIRSTICYFVTGLWSNWLIIQIAHKTRDPQTVDQTYSCVTTRAEDGKNSHIINNFHRGCHHSWLLFLLPSTVRMLSFNYDMRFGSKPYNVLSKSRSNLVKYGQSGLRNLFGNVQLNTKSSTVIFLNDIKQRGEKKYWVGIGNSLVFDSVLPNVTSGWLMWRVD